MSNQELCHPMDDPLFNPSKCTVWYLSHPLAPDAKYSFRANMQHVVHMMRLCFEEDFNNIAPYHTVCLALDDANAEHRRMGLEADCVIVRKLARIILCGHRRSRGMELEYSHALVGIGKMLDQIPQAPDEARRDFINSRIVDLVGRTDTEARHILREHKQRYSSGRQEV